MDLKKFQEKGEHFFQWLDTHLAGVPSIIRRALETFGLAFASEAAAGISYYALFALFPLLLLLTSVASRWLSNTAAVDQVVNFIGQLFEIPPGQLETALADLTATSGISGLIGLIGLIWATTGVFTSLARNISRAWPDASRVSVLQGRLMAIIMVAIIALSQFVWVIATTIVGLIAQIDLSLGRDISHLKSLLTDATLNGVAFALIFLAFAGLYRWVPKTQVRWREALVGAAFSTLATLIASRVYIWYVNSPFANTNSVYGSLGTTLGLIVFFYLNAWIVLFGAHLSSAVSHRHRLKVANQVAEPLPTPDSQAPKDGNDSLPN